MSQQLDEKRHVIMPLLDKLRQYNPAIGSYDKSMMNTNFNYSVKLSNGTIEIVEELVTDYERAASGITEDRYKITASKFISNAPPQTPPPTPQPKVAQQVATKPEKKSPLTRIVLIAIVVIVAIYFFSH